MNLDEAIAFYFLGLATGLIAVCLVSVYWPRRKNPDPPVVESHDDADWWKRPYEGDD